MRTAKTDQTGQMPRLIRVLAWCTCHFAGFVMRQLKCVPSKAAHPSSLISLRCPQEEGKVCPAKTLIRLLMHRLVWVFNGCMWHFVGFAMSHLITKNVPFSPGRPSMPGSPPGPGSPMSPLILASSGGDAGSPFWPIKIKLKCFD